MSTVRQAFAAALAVCCAGGASAADHVYSTAQTVSETIAGDDTVTVSCPSGQFVTFTGDNSYSGGTTLSSGGIIVSSRTALGTGKIKCASGTAIRVTVDYTSESAALTAALIDRIEVQTAGTDDPYVSFQLTGDGLKNDVDFSGQPHLWLGAPCDRSYVMKGTFTPYGTEYHLGREGSGTGYGTDAGLKVLPLTDASDGTARSAVVCGTSMIGLTGAATMTGSLEVRSGATVCVTRGDSMGTNVILRGGARVNVKKENVIFPAEVSFSLSGTVQFHNCGAELPNRTEIRGSVGGTGKIRATDIGGMLFSGANNTYTGEIGAEGTNAKKPVIEIGFGDGTHCSWCGSKVSAPQSSTNLTVSVNCDSDVTIDTDFGSVGGRLIKRGTGTLTLGAAYRRTQISPDCPVMEIFAGTVRLAQALPSATKGLVRIGTGGSLDLNGLSDVCWLPYGGGDIVNPKGGALALCGTAFAGCSFGGRLEGSVTVSETKDDVAWRLAEGCAVPGSLTLSDGDFEMSPGVTIAQLEIPFGRHVSFVGDSRRDWKGLGVELWKPGSAWSGSDVSAKFAAAKKWIAEWNPDRTTDMTAYGEVFYSEEGGAKSPLVALWGPVAVSDQFAARFRGHFIAPSAGTYAFKMYADDAAELHVDGVKLAESRCSDAVRAVSLAAGSHSVEILYCEVAQLQYLNLSYRAPGSDAYVPLPVSLLSAMPVPAPHSQISRVTGKGTLSVAEDGTWPEALGLDDFGGRLLAGGGAGAATAGAVTPGSAEILFAGDDSLAGTNWTLKGTFELTNETAGVGLLLPGAADVWGALNTSHALPLSQPFALSFDLETVKPSNNNMGDGFGVFLHDGKTGWHNGTWSSAQDKTRVGDASAYGFQNHASNYGDTTGWVRNGASLGDVESHSWSKGEFGLSYIGNSPMHVTVTWDLEKLVYRQTRKTYVWAATNEVAATDIPAIFPDGAHLGVWSVCGGRWTSMHFSNVRLVVGDGPSARESTLGGTVVVTNGTVTVRADGTGATPVWEADLRVTGAGSLVPASGTTFVCGADVWTFDLSNPATHLTFGTGVTFPTDAASQTISVRFDGEPDAAWREIADLSAVGVTAAGLTFVSPVERPRCEFRYANGKLSVRKVLSGAILIIR